MAAHPQDVMPKGAPHQPGAQDEWYWEGEAGKAVSELALTKGGDLGTRVQRGIQEEALWGEMRLSRRRSGCWERDHSWYPRLGKKNWDPR